MAYSIVMVLVSVELHMSRSVHFLDFRRFYHEIIFFVLPELNHLLSLLLRVFSNAYIK